MSDALLGVLIGGGIGLFGSALVQVLAQVFLLRRERQERARSVRSVALDSLPSAIDSVLVAVTQALMMPFAESLSTSYKEEMIHAALNAVAAVHRARVSMMAISAPSEVFVAFDEVSTLLRTLATKGQQVDVVEGITTVLGQLEKQYMAMKLTSDKLVAR